MKSKPSANEHFQREKARRAKKGAPDTELMAAARREYEALLEAQAKKGKGGRPKKKPVAKPADIEDEIEDVDLDSEDAVDEK
jgi:hypothetical protein